MSWVARFLPSLVPGLSAFMNPTVLVICGVALLAAFTWGVLWEKERFDEYRGGVEAVGKAQEKWSRERNIQLNAAKKRSEDEWKKRIASRTRTHELELDRVRNAIPSGGIVPQPGPSTDPAVQGLVCFKREELDAGIRGSLRGFLERVGRIIQKGDGAREDFGLASAWANQVGSCHTN